MLIDDCTLPAIDMPKDGVYLRKHTLHEIDGACREVWLASAAASSL
jgi:hypothetical protein